MKQWCPWNDGLVRKYKSTIQISQTEQVKVFASVLATILLKMEWEEFNVVEGESELCKKVWKLGIGRCYSSSLENSWYLWQILRKSGFGGKYRRGGDWKGGPDKKIMNVFKTMPRVVDVGIWEESTLRKVIKKSEQKW